jgi:hypothetical protein
MSALDEWPHKWFGVWREMGPNYASCPSIFDWVNPEESSNYKEDLERILIYLRTATVIAATSAAAFPNIFTGENKHGSVSFRTDGIWVWLDNLACYVEQNKIALPRNFYLHIKEQSYIPPDASEVKPEELDWPEI